MTGQIGTRNNQKKSVDYRLIMTQDQKRLSKLLSLLSGCKWADHPELDEIRQDGEKYITMEHILNRLDDLIRIDESSVSTT